MCALFTLLYSARAKLREVTELRKQATEALAAAQRDLASTQQHLEGQTAALASCNAQLTVSRCHLGG